MTTLEVSFWRIINGFGNLGSFVVLMLPPDPGSLARAMIFVKALFETIAIAFLGTILAAILAFPLGFIAAKNVVANRVVHFLARRSLDTVRGVDALIWALIWVNVVGLGPFAGMLAIMTSDLGAFGKLYSEAIEAADRKPVEGVTSMGGSKLHEIRFGLIPQVLPVIASQVLVLHRIQHPLLDHHRHRRGGRDRALSGRDHPHAGMAAGLLPDPADPRGRLRDRLPVEQAALRDHRAKGGLSQAVMVGLDPTISETSDFRS